MHLPRLLRHGGAGRPCLAQPPPPAAVAWGQPSWGSAPRPPVSAAEWAPSQPLQLQVFVISGQAMPILSAAMLKQAAVVAGLELTASLGPSVSALQFSKDTLPHAEVDICTRDALYTLTAECTADDATFGPGNTRLLYDTGAAMCVCGPGQLPLLVTHRTPRTLMGAGSTRLVSDYSGVLTLRFGPPSAAPPVQQFNWPRGFRPSKYRPLTHFLGSLFWAPQIDTVAYALAIQDGFDSDSGGEMVPLGGDHPRRASHHRLIRGAQALHERYGVTDPAIFKDIHLTAAGVERISSTERERFLSLPYVVSANRRTPVHSTRVEQGEFVAGAAASLDLTRSFVCDVDGYVLSAIFMDLRTCLLWESPMRNHSCAEFIRVLAKYVAYVRDFFPRGSPTYLLRLRPGVHRDPAGPSTEHGLPTSICERPAIPPRLYPLAAAHAGPEPR